MVGSESTTFYVHMGMAGKLLSSFENGEQLFVLNILGKLHLVLYSEKATTVLL